MRKFLLPTALAALAIAVPSAANATAMFALDIYASGSNTSLDNPRFLLTNTSTAGEAITKFTLSYSGVSTIIDVVSGCGQISAPPAVACGTVSPTTSNGQGAQTGIVDFTSFPATGQAAFRFEFDEPGVNASTSDFRNVLFNNNANVKIDYANGTSITTQLGKPADAAVYSYTGAVAAVPEPATWAMMLVGFGMIGGVARRTAKASDKRLTAALA